MNLPEGRNVGNKLHGKNLYHDLPIYERFEKRFRGNLWETKMEAKANKYSEKRGGG